MAPDLDLILDKLESIESRLRVLEGKKPQASAPSAAWPTTTQTVKTTANKPSSSAWPTTTGGQQSAPPAPRQSEADLAKKWFSRVGGALLIIGVALFLTYTFRYFGPWYKILIGLVSSLVIIGLGWWQKDKKHVLGQVLMAVGWCLLYLTTFASYHIPAAQVITSLPFNLLLLFTVAGGMGLWAVKLKEELFVVITLLFTTIAIGTSNISIVGFGAIIIMILYSLAMQAYLKRDHIGLYALPLAYWCYALPFLRGTASLNAETLPMAIAFLTTYAVINLIGTIIISWQRQDHKFHVVTAIINAALYFAIAAGQLSAVGWDQYERLLTGGCLAVALATAIGLYARHQRWDLLGLTHIWLAWIFSALLLIDISSDWGRQLIFIGYGSALVLVATFRGWRRLMIAGCLTVALSVLFYLTEIDNSQSVVTLGNLSIQALNVALLFNAACYLAMAIVWERFGQKLVPAHTFALMVPGFAVSVFLLHFIGHNASTPASGIWVLLLATAWFCWGLHTRWTSWRAVSILSWVAFDLYWIMTLDDPARLGNGQWPLTAWATASILAAIIGYSGYAICTQLQQAQKDLRTWSTIFVSAATIVLAAYLGMSFSANYIAVLWGAQGILLLGSGLYWHQSRLRLPGAIMLGLAAIRVTIFDLAFLHPIWRIVSFIILGLLFLSVAYLYYQFQDKEIKK